MRKENPLDRFEPAFRAMGISPSSERHIASVDVDLLTSIPAWRPDEGIIGTVRGTRVVVAFYGGVTIERVFAPHEPYEREAP